MDFHEISELNQKSLHEQDIENSELLNIIYSDSASLNICECKVLQILVNFGKVPTTLIFIDVSDPREIYRLFVASLSGFRRRFESQVIDKYVIL